MNITGKKEVWEAVLIAGLSALATGLVELIMEEIKEHKKAKTAKKDA